MALLVAIPCVACQSNAKRETPQSARTGELSVRPGVNDSYQGEDFDIEKWLSRFEVESREIVKHRNGIIQATGAAPGMTIADIGAGTGLLTGLFAKQVGPTGKVFAVDIVPELLQHIRTRVAEEKITNVETVLCTEDSVELPPESIDVALICDTYHHFEYPNSTMTSLHQALKPGGVVVIIDFKRIPNVSRAWILQHVRAGKETVIKEIQAAGFELINDGRTHRFLKETYLIRFRKIG